MAALPLVVYDSTRDFVQCYLFYQGNNAGKGQNAPWHFHKNVL